MKNLRVLLSLVLCVSMASVQAMQPAVDATAQQAPAQQQDAAAAPQQAPAANVAQAGMLNRVQNFLVSPQFGIGLTVVLGLVGAFIVLKKTLFSDDERPATAQRQSAQEAAERYAEQLDLMGQMVQNTPTTAQEVFNNTTGNPREAARQRRTVKQRFSNFVNQVSGKKGRA